MNKRAKNIAVGIFAFLLGLFVTLVAAGVIPSSDKAFHAPRWVVGLCGMLFMVGGLAVLAAQHRRLRQILVIVLLGTFFVVALWASLFTRPESWGGGLPFLSRRVNAVMAKTAVKSGAALLLFGFIRAVQGLWRDRRSQEGQKNS